MELCMSIPAHFSALLLSVTFSSFLLASPANKIFEQTFATAIVLSDNDAISIGIANFNPDTLLNPNENDLSEDDSIALRNELDIYNLPYTFVLDKQNEEWSDKVMLRLTYIKQESNNEFLGDIREVPDSNIDKIYSLYSAYSHYIPVANKLKLRLRLGAYIMHYKNKHHYNSAFSNNLKPFVDGVIYNTIAIAAIIEPNAKLTYTQETNWGKWQLASDLNYFVGKVYSGSKSSIGAVPDGWRINNGVKLHFDLNSSALHAESIYLNFKRIDMHGDMTDPLQTNHYYEMGVGLLLDTHKFTNLAKNIGIGLNINKGTSLSGGSIVIYFNEF